MHWWQIKVVVVTIEWYRGKALGKHYLAFPALKANEIVSALLLILLAMRIPTMKNTMVFSAMTTSSYISHYLALKANEIGFFQFPPILLAMRIQPWYFQP